MQLTTQEERFWERCLWCDGGLAEASPTRDYCPECTPPEVLADLMAQIKARAEWLASPEGERWSKAQAAKRCPEKDAECDRLLADLFRRQRSYQPPARLRDPSACRSNPHGRSHYA
jgi:hypothetical protein